MAASTGAARRRLDLDEVGSTNTVALEAARAGDPGPLWVTAARQAAGRGRRARTWVSERGNVYATLLLIDPAPPEALGNLPLVVALGVRNGIASLAGLSADAVAIKWPNDILVSGRKTAGILIESERLTDGRAAVVVGCGINVEHVPAETPYPVTSLRREGCTADLAAVFGGIATGVEDALRLWRNGRNFASIRANWLNHAKGIGQPCRINLHDRAIDGIFSSLDDAGRLVLTEPGGAVRSISAGDLFLLAPNGDAEAAVKQAANAPPREMCANAESGA